MPKTVGPFLLAFYYIFNQFLGVLLPLTLSTDLLLDVVLIEVRLVHDALDDQFLQILRKTEELLLIYGVYQRLGR